MTLRDKVVAFNYRQRETSICLPFCAQRPQSLGVSQLTKDSISPFCLLDPTVDSMIIPMWEKGWWDEWAEFSLCTASPWRASFRFWQKALSSEHPWSALDRLCLHNICLIGLCLPPPRVITFSEAGNPVCVPPRSRGNRPSSLNSR